MGETGGGRQPKPDPFYTESDLPGYGLGHAGRIGVRSAVSQIFSPILYGGSALSIRHLEDSIDGRR